MLSRNQAWFVVCILLAIGLANYVRADDKCGPDKLWTFNIPGWKDPVKLRDAASIRCKAESSFAQAPQEEDKPLPFHLGGPLPPATEWPNAR